MFPGDIDMPHQAYMKILFAGRPHAIIHRLDTSAAERVPGVLGVFTAKDVPVNEYGLNLNDQPVLCGPGSSKPHAERVRFVGDQLAVVVAESEEIAAEATKLIEVEFEDLPIITDPEQAMQEGALRLHPDRENNILHHNRIRKGDVEAGFAESAVVIETEYRTPAQEHAFLQPEAGLAYIDDEGRVTVEVAGQWVHEDQRQIAHALDLPVDKVRVKYPAIGGAFGGREDMSVQIVLALAAWRLHARGIDRPIKIIWSREESIFGHNKRHPFVIRAKWGATAQGKLLAAEVRLIQDGGAYAYTSIKVLGNATLMCTGPYLIPNVKVDAYSVYTNHIPGGAFRGFGGPQAAFAAEMQIEKLAEALELDPVELRARNVIKEGDLLSVESPLPEGVTMDRVIESCAEGAGWTRTSGKWEAPEIEQPDEPHLRRGIGFACGFKNVGFSLGHPDECWATVELHGRAEIEEVVLRHAGAEVGQGAHTVLVQMAAEAAGVPLSKVRLDPSDTATSENSGSASASRMTFMAGHAIRGAVEAAMVKWQEEDRPAIAKYQYRPPPTTSYDSETGQSEPNFAYGYVAEAATVEVDTEIGAVRILDVVCADDVGRVINPQGVQGQIEGAIVQAAGYAILEDFKQEGGEVQTGRFSTYLIPGIWDIPERVHPIILEYEDPGGPWGVRGMAEMPFIPLTPAVTAAIHNALGVWYDEFPLTPERVLWGIHDAGAE
ncbi:MAG: xanthine dehydrogenase family protein [Chloroflexi bacterium]|nr:xanthine dehydrogenase family protein [Chloroflexota bacterium]